MAVEWGEDQVPCSRLRSLTEAPETSGKAETQAPDGSSLFQDSPLEALVQASLRMSLHRRSRPDPAVAMFPKAHRAACGGPTGPGPLCSASGEPGSRWLEQGTQGRPAGAMPPSSPGGSWGLPSPSGPTNRG